jgi:hypothetical protein
MGFQPMHFQSGKIVPIYRKEGAQHTSSWRAVVVITASKFMRGHRVEQIWYYAPGGLDLITQDNG